jgi:pyridoxine/pyridoxamine 5'-phosphate oxidase
MPIQLHPNQIPLESHAIIWRYMDIAKYESLLDRKALFFCRADKFSDPFEGTLLKKEADNRLFAAKENAKFSNKLFDEERAKKNIEDLSYLHKSFKRGIIINCWHINNNESDAMWRLYLKDNEGVAIQSTKKRILETIEKAKETIEFSKVRYLDYDNDIWYHPEDYPHIKYNLIIPFMHKRIEFYHEQEFRLYHEVQEAIDNENYWDTQENHKGKFIEINLTTLVEKILFPPTIDNKTVEKIVNLTTEKGFNFKFEKSKLQNEPYY